MADSRIEKAAKILVDYSAKVKKGDRVMVLADPESASLCQEVYKLVLQRGGLPNLKIGLPNLSYTYFKYANVEQLKTFPEVSMFEIKHTDCWIAIGATNNTKELANIPQKKIAIRMKVTEPISNYRVDKTRWVIFDYPAAAFAQEADMSVQEYEDFVYGATNIDWNKEVAFLKKVKARFDKAKMVRITAPGTDVYLSLVGRTAIIDDGQRNMPGGEVFMGPVETDVNGHVQFTYAASYTGKEVEDIRLEFKKGKVVKATASKNQDVLTQVLKTDKGANYLGELGIGCNYKIDRFTKNTLFDEKIGGTIHLALGRAYKEGGGKNISAVHWDIVCDLRKGGKIYLDGKLFQKDGKFIF